MVEGTGAGVVPGRCERRGMKVDEAEIVRQRLVELRNEFPNVKFYGWDDGSVVIQDREGFLYLEKDDDK